MQRGLAALLLVLFAAGAAPHARADGGYFSGTSGARAAGRGGAFVARADDLSAVHLNPAGLARLETTLVQVGNRASYNAHSFERAPTLDWGDLENGVPPYVEFARVENADPWQVLEPLFGVASNLGLPDFGFALSARAPAGIGEQEFPVDGGQRYLMVSRNVVLLEYGASVAWQSAGRFGLGATAQWLHLPKLDYQLVVDGNVFPGEANPVSNELDMLATVTSSDAFTLNAVLGAWYRPVPFLELAISGQVIPAEFDSAGDLSIDALSPAIDQQVELSRDGDPASDVRLSLPLPLTARAGIRYRGLRGGRELFDVELDVAYQTWSRVESFVVDGDGLVATLRGQRIDVGRIEIERRWRDTVSVHLGGDYAALPQLALRGGVFYESAVAERGYAHVDFVSGPQLGGALGASWFVFGVEIALAYGFRHQPAVQVREGDARIYQEAPGSQCRPPFTDSDACHPQYLGQPAPAVNAGSYRAYSHVLSLDLLYRH